jgi:hypothetical protein
MNSENNGVFMVISLLWLNNLAGFDRMARYFYSWTAIALSATGLLTHQSSPLRRHGTTDCGSFRFLR